MNSTSIRLSIFLLFSALSLSQPASSQILYYSQVDRLPLLVNPATAGNSDYGVRLLTGYKNFRDPHNLSNTIQYFSLDRRLMNDGKNMIGAGISGFNRDLNQSLHIAINYKRNIKETASSIHRISIALEPGIINSKLIFTSASGTSSNINPLRININAGILWQTIFNSGNEFVLGVSSQQLNRIGETIDFGLENKRPVSYTLHLSYSYWINTSLKLIPLLLYSQQGFSNKFIVGTSIRKFLGDSIDNKYFQLGLSAKWKSFKAIIPVLSLNLDRFNFGLSIDIPYPRRFTQPRSIKSSIELTAGYLFGTKSTATKK